MSLVERRPALARRLALIAALLVTTLVYWPGLSGGYIFDDYPNIIENPALQVQHADWATLKAAALSSPSSEFHRPLSSLTFVANYMTTGLAPFGWKLTNLVIHLLNGVLVYLLARALLCAAARGREEPRAGLLAALIAAGWLLLPINLTAVLYVVQRMESLANLFVLLGLLGYVRGRLRMQRDGRGFAGAVASLLVWTAIGLTAKETAVMTPFYAALIEWALFSARSGRGRRRDRRVLWLFALVLVLPGLAGLAWLLPDLVLNPVAWQARNFTLGERLLSEPRIWFDYLRWIVLPTPHALSFYHDEIRVSTGLLAPWTTLAAILGLALLVALIAFLRARAPLVALGLALFLGAQLLTGTIIPLELVYEQRNYFASFGVLLAMLPLLFSARVWRTAAAGARRAAGRTAADLDRRNRADRLRLEHPAAAGDGTGRTCADLAARAIRTGPHLHRAVEIRSEVAVHRARLSAAGAGDEPAGFVDPARAGADLHERAHGQAAEAAVVAAHDRASEIGAARRAGRKLAGGADPVRDSGRLPAAALVDGRGLRRRAVASAPVRAGDADLCRLRAQHPARPRVGRAAVDRCGQDPARQLRHPPHAARGAGNAGDGRAGDPGSGEGRERRRWRIRCIAGGNGPRATPRALRAGAMRRSPRRSAA